MRSLKVLAMFGHCIADQQKAFQSAPSLTEIVNIGRSCAMVWDLYIEKVSVAEREHLESLLVVCSDIIVYSEGYAETEPELYAYHKQRLAEYDELNQH